MVKLSSFSGISDYRLINRLLAFTLYFSLIKTIIDTDNKLDILGELIGSIYFSDLILNIFLKSLVKLGDIGIVALV